LPSNPRPTRRNADNGHPPRKPTRRLPAARKGLRLPRRRGHAPSRAVDVGEEPCRPGPKDLRASGARPNEPDIGSESGVRARLAALETRLPSGPNGQPPRLRTAPGETQKLAGGLASGHLSGRSPLSVAYGVSCRVRAERDYPSRLRGIHPDKWFPRSALGGFGLRSRVVLKNKV